MPSWISFICISSKLLKFLSCDFPTRSHLRKQVDFANDCESHSERIAKFANPNFANLANLFSPFSKTVFPSFTVISNRKSKTESSKRMLFLKVSAVPWYNSRATARGASTPVSFSYKRAMFMWPVTPSLENGLRRIRGKFNTARHSCDLQWKSACSENTRRWQLLFQQCIVIDKR